MPRRVVPAAIAAIAVALSLAACAGAPMSDRDTPAQPALTATPGALPTPTPAADGMTGAPVDVPPARWDAIVADLANRDVAGIPTLVSAYAVTWSDGSLGCPSPGQSYTQALVDGLRVIVAVDGTDYDYRFGTTDEPKLCEQQTFGFGRSGTGAAR